ncbi:hypothetical protein GIB67_014617 [Kingdonia uniflora]|uniref:Uncharacterized protein n=1 Tax=Kingdonia uniflora TaxID=39325 RepID=A0A7J7NV05_9MAGN|nr:hypothetical protein GIB67_014617 [Kingdonia uniflora]
MSHTIALSNTITSLLATPTTCSPHHKNQSKKSNLNPQKSLGFGKTNKNQKQQQLSWQCVTGCGACCKLNKGPLFATPEEIFENPSDIELYKSMVGEDGWCVHYEKTSRTCSIYSDRPHFCRVELDVFKTLYGIDEKKFNKEACSFCVDTIKAIYGARSPELENFNRAIRKPSSS